MSLKRVKTIFENIQEGEQWSIHVLRINSTKRNGVVYVSREIYLESMDKLKEHLSRVSKYHIDEKKGMFNAYTDVVDYDGTTIGSVIYKMKKNNELIGDKCTLLMESLALADVESNPLEDNKLEDNLQAYVLKGIIELETEKYPIKLISMQNPIVSLKNKFLQDKGKFYEINKKVLSLRAAIDVIIIGDDIYMLTLAGEKLFDMERSYKAVCSYKMQEIEECDIIVDFAMFNEVACSGHNPRRFVAYKENRLRKLKDYTFRKHIAQQFDIPMKGNKFAPQKEKDAEKIVKLLCNRGMMDPFEDVPVEVEGAKRWS